MARFRDPELIPYVAVLLLTLLVVTSYNTSLRSDTRSVTGGTSSETVGVVRSRRPNVGGAGGGVVHGPDESHVAAAKMGYVHNPRHKAETFNNIREPTTHQKLHNKIVHNRDHKDAHSHASQTNLESITDGLASLFHSTREEDHEMLNKIMTHQKELKHEIHRLRKELDEVLTGVEMLNAKKHGGADAADGSTRTSPVLKSGPGRHDVVSGNTSAASENADTDTDSDTDSDNGEGKRDDDKSPEKGAAASAVSASSATTPKLEYEDGWKPGDPVEDGIYFLFTSNGNPYSNFQTRFLYHSYLEVKDEPGSLLRGITRILHRSADDELMDEVPTVRVQPVTPECERWCGFPVYDRPFAVQSFFEVDKRPLRYKYILLGEPDYLFIKPFTSKHLPPLGEANAFPYGYIVPTYNEKNQKITRRITRNKFETVAQMSSIPGTGPCPVVTQTELFADKIVPLWVEYTKRVEQDEEAKKEFGWVREMYAYSFAVAELGVKHHVPSVDDGNLLMSQPPADQSPRETSMMHYTWGTELRLGATFNKTSEIIWEFDKRLFSGGMPHRHLPYPPKSLPSDFGTEYWLQNGVKVSQSLLDFLRRMITIMNGAIDRFDAMECGEGSEYGMSCPTDHAPECRRPWKCDGDAYLPDPFE